MRYNASALTVNLNTSGMTVQQLIKDAADHFGDKVCIRYGRKETGGQYTFREFNELMPFSMNIIGRRIRGGRIIMLIKDRELLLRWMMSVMYCGGVAVPMNMAQDKETLNKIIVHIAPEAIVAEENEIQYWEKNLSDELAKKIIRAEEADEKRQSVLRPEAVRPDSAAIIIHTSGTTGNQKGVVLTHENFLGNNVLPTVSWVNILKMPVYTFSILPYYHVMALIIDVIMPFMTGGCVTINSDEKNFLDGIRESHSNALACVPMVLNFLLNLLKMKLLDHPDIPKKEIKNGLLGKDLLIVACSGARVDPEIRDEIEEFGLYVLIGYGMTEMTGQVATDVFTMFGKRKKNAVGKISPVMQWKNTESGELAVKGPGIMKEYWKMPEETAKVLRGGWFYTGDLVDVDEEGYCFFKGRCKNLIIASDGENISPEGIEKILSDSLCTDELRVSEGKGGLHLDIGLKGRPVPDDLEKILLSYNRKRRMSWQLRSYSIYKDSLEKNASGKIIRDSNRIESRERIYI